VAVEALVISKAAGSTTLSRVRPATDRSTSSAVVLQFDTEIRMRRRPCHVVAPIPALARALHVGDRIGLLRRRTSRG
jgi:hypothetical protein